MSRWGHRCKEHAFIQTRLITDVQKSLHFARDPNDELYSRDVIVRTLTRWSGRRDGLPDRGRAERHALPSAASAPVDRVSRTDSSSTVTTSAMENVYGNNTCRLITVGLPAIRVRAGESDTP